MQIIDFTHEWIDPAKALVYKQVEEEARFTPSLPPACPLPSMASLCENGLGVAAVEKGQLLGFLCAYGPWKPVFTTPHTAGVFSPLHAHGVQPENRGAIWQRLYQAAAEKWVQAGAVSHALSLFRHDTAAQEALYLYGFGVRCMDLMQSMGEMAPALSPHVRELPPSDQALLHPLRRRLSAHLAQSPCFMHDTEEMIARWLNQRMENPPRAFVYESNSRIIAYMEATPEGENFLSSSPGIMNICGAYCLPEYRGSGTAKTLLRHMAAVLQMEGYRRMGVDCESFNPTALHFWGKHFQAYTHSVVRRIDENILL